MSCLRFLNDFCHVGCFLPCLSRDFRFFPSSSCTDVDAQASAALRLMGCSTMCALVFVDALAGVYVCA